LVIKTTLISGFTFLLLSCGQPTAKKEIQSAISTDTAKIGQPVETVSPHQQELNKALDDPAIDDYYKNIYKQGKIIAADDNKMLSITDSLFTSDRDKDLFYFVVFTKSLNGADGFYSESTGLASYNFITKKTEWFADYFNVVPQLTEHDMDNWAGNILGEILASRENQEVKAIRELEGQLFNNILRARKEYKVVIEEFMKSIKNKARLKGFRFDGQ
jgi:hypothetical protein